MAEYFLKIFRIWRNNIFCFQGHNHSAEWLWRNISWEIPSCEGISHENIEIFRHNHSAMKILKYSAIIIFIHIHIRFQGIRILKSSAIINHILESEYEYEWIWLWRNISIFSWLNIWTFEPLYDWSTRGGRDEQAPYIWKEPFLCRALLQKRHIFKKPMNCCHALKVWHGVFIKLSYLIVRRDMNQL